MTYTKVLLLVSSISQVFAAESTDITFLRKVSNIENVDFFNIINLKEDISKIWNVRYKKPLMTLKNSSQPLKLLFNSNMLTIVTASNESSFEGVFQSLKFNEASKIAIIIEKYEHVSKILLVFYKRNFVHVIAICLEHQHLYSFELFPKFLLRTVPINKIFENKVKNINQHPIKFSCLPKSIPKCISTFDQKTARYKFGGYITNIIRNFAYFVNGSFQPSIYIDDAAEDAALLSADVDFMTHIPVLVPSEIIRLQRISDTLEVIDGIVIVPVPKRINVKYYCVKPFTLSMWIGLAVAIVYFTSVISFTVFVLTGKLDLSYYFGKVIRSLVNQPFSFGLFKKVTWFPVHYLLLQLFGFIVCTWYLAILGSFMTADLYERPIDSYEELEKTDLKILYNKDAEWLFNYMHGDIRNYLHLFEATNPKDFIKKINGFDQSYAYPITTDHWRNYFMPQMQFYSNIRFRISKMIIGSVHLNLNFNSDSIYKERVNRFLQLIKDTGLYKHWSEQVFLENMRLKVYEEHFHLKHLEQRSNALGLNYFQLIFMGWILGVSIAMASFIVEILRSFLKFEKDICSSKH